jgi:hypothetical protein
MILSDSDKFRQSAPRQAARLAFLGGRAQRLNVADRDTFTFGRLM